MKIHAAFLLSGLLATLGCGGVEKLDLRKASGSSTSNSSELALTSEIAGSAANVSIGLSGTGTGRVGQTIKNKKTLTLTATAFPQSKFVKWSGACTGSKPSCDVDDTKKATVIAVFAAPAGFIAVHAQPTAPASEVVCGTANCVTPPTGVIRSADSKINCGDEGGETACDTLIPANTSFVLTATPHVAGGFLGWSGDCAKIVGAQCTVNSAKGVIPVANYK